MQKCSFVVRLTFLPAAFCANQLLNSPFPLVMLDPVCSVATIGAMTYPLPTPWHRRQWYFHWSSDTPHGVSRASSTAAALPEAASQSNRSTASKDQGFPAAELNLCQFSPPQPFCEYATDMELQMEQPKNRLPFHRFQGEAPHPAPGSWPLGRSMSPTGPKTEQRGNFPN